MLDHHPLTHAVPDFRCEVRPDRSRVIVAAHGELDLATAPAVEAELRDLRGAGFTELVVDLGGVTFLDSSGIALLVRWCREPGTTLLVEHVPATVHRVLELAGVCELLGLRAP